MLIKSSKMTFVRLKRGIVEVSESEDWDQG